MANMSLEFFDRGQETADQGWGTGASIKTLTLKNCLNCDLQD